MTTNKQLNHGKLGPQALKASAGRGKRAFRKHEVATEVSSGKVAQIQHAYVSYLNHCLYPIRDACEKPEANPGSVEIASKVLGDLQVSKAEIASFEKRSTIHGDLGSYDDSMRRVAMTFMDALNLYLDESKNKRKSS